VTEDHDYNNSDNDSLVLDYGEPANRQFDIREEPMKNHSNTNSDQVATTVSTTKRFDDNFLSPESGDTNIASVPDRPVGLNLEIVDKKPSHRRSKILFNSKTLKAYNDMPGRLDSKWDNIHIYESKKDLWKTLTNPQDPNKQFGFVLLNQIIGMSKKKKKNKRRSQLHRRNGS